MARMECMRLRKSSSQNSSYRRNSDSTNSNSVTLKSGDTKQRSSRTTNSHLEGSLPTPMANIGLCSSILGESGAAKMTSLSTSTGWWQSVLVFSLIFRSKVSTSTPFFSEPMIYYSTLISQASSVGTYTLHSKSSPKPDGITHLHTHLCNSCILHHQQFETLAS